MILKGNQRGGGGQLARHLSNATDNDHVELHEIRGLAAEDMAGAFAEIEAVANGTKCQQPFFSVSLSPPAGYPATVDQFDMALDAIEAKYPGLAQQPRVVVFHEKEGRRHAHAVWSRIDGEAMKAIPLPFSRERLREASRDTFQNMGLAVPAGLQDRRQADPLNYGPAVWQQAKRMNEAPADFKAIIQAAWAQSDNRASFEQALGQHGLMLAQGDRRGFVAIHHSGEALSLTRYAGIKAKEAAAKIGPADQLPTVDQARQALRDRVMAGAAHGLDHLKREQARALRPMRDRVVTMKQAHQQERQALHVAQERRQRQEGLIRGNRLRTGFMGLWDRVTGRRGKIAELNVRQATAGRVRDRDERQGMIDRQQGERGRLQAEIVIMRRQHQGQRQAARADLAILLGTAKGQGRGKPSNSPPKSPVHAFQTATAAQEQDQGRERKPRQPRPLREDRRQARQDRVDRPAGKGTADAQKRPVEAANDFMEGHAPKPPEATHGQDLGQGDDPASWTKEQRAARVAAQVAAITAEDQAKANAPIHDRGRGMRR